MLMTTPKPGTAADISGVYLYLVRERMWLLLHYSDILIIIQFTVSPHVTLHCAGQRPHYEFCGMIYYWKESAPTFRHGHQLIFLMRVELFWCS